MNRSYCLTVLSLLCLACSIETIVAAREERSTDAGSMVAPACRAQADCDFNEYCRRTPCNAARGVCQIRPGSCAPGDAPVCGCDRITYLNDCLREAAGVNLYSRGQCTSTAMRCGGQGRQNCPEGSYCGALVPAGPVCMRDAPGTCWVVPAECGSSSLPGDRFVPCRQSPPECVDACTAIKRQQPYGRVSECPFMGP